MKELQEIREKAKSSEVQSTRDEPTEDFLDDAIEEVPEQSEVLIGAKIKMREIREEGRMKQVVDKMKELQEDVNADPVLIDKLAKLNKFCVNRGRAASNSQTPLLLPDTEGQTRLSHLAGVQKLQRAVKSRKFDFLKYMLG